MTAEISAEETDRARSLEAHLSDSPMPEFLVAPAQDIFPSASVFSALDQLSPSGKEATTGLRLEAAKILRTTLDDGHAVIRRAFETKPLTGFRVAQSIAWLTDQVVRTAFVFVSTRLFPLANPTKAERITLAAVGGYGRGEMAPFSDVDLLFLTPYKQTAWGESVIEATLYLLWDLRLKVGHSTRSVEDCLRLASKDITIRTALLEKRFIYGDTELFETLDQRLWSELFANTGPDFVEAKLAERDKRHSQHGGSRYLLEPNIKESKGGLRDLQTLYWIAKYLYRANSVQELVEKAVFTRHELVRFQRAEAHLWTVRCALHYTAGRPNERLTFDRQIEVARLLNYTERGGQLAVERFMKRYFLAATDVGNLTRIFCAALESQHKKRPPFVGSLLRALTLTTSAPTGLSWLEMRDGRLAVTEAKVFKDDPVNILRVFDTAIRVGTLVHPSTLRLIERHKQLIDDEVRRRPEASSLFVDLIASSADPVRALRRMSETSILGRFVPDFQRVTGLMQFNMYHHFTVDEHTISVIENFAKIASGKLRDEHPIETNIAQSLKDRRVITMALLLHDIGKGLPGDHSVVGEEIARQECEALGFSSAETEIIAWLVREHLTMSDIAQKRDLSDMATIRGFAEAVRSPERLRLLYLLTVCDIRGVGPGIWNNWKGQLLRELFIGTRDFMTGDARGRSRDQRVSDAQRALSEALPDWTEAQKEERFGRFAAPYWLGLDTETHLAHAELMATANHPLEMAVRQAPQRDATEVSFFTPDHPGLFARMAGAFALVGASVVDARAYTGKDGVALNTFWVQDADGEAYDDDAAVERLRDEVLRLLMGEVVARDALKSRRALKKREKSFHIPSRITFDNTGSDTHTIIEVNARDRVGLLHDLARALTAVNVNIASAIIATYGEHAVDVFYVRDLFGMKISQPSKQKRIEEALLAAVEQGATTVPVT